MSAPSVPDLDPNIKSHVERALNDHFQRVSRHLPKLWTALVAVALCIGSIAAWGYSEVAKVDHLGVQVQTLDTSGGKALDKLRDDSLAQERETDKKLHRIDGNLLRVLDKLKIEPLHDDQ